MMKNMGLFMAYTLAGIMSGESLGPIYDTGRKKSGISFDPAKFSEEDLKQYLENERVKKMQYAELLGLKSFHFFVADVKLTVYAKNEKNGYRKIRNQMLEILKQFGEKGLEYPEFKLPSGIQITGFRKTYENPLKNKL